MIKVFLDSADINDMGEFAPAVQGFTTNPSLMRKAGIDNYEAWGREVCSRFPNHPVSFEVVADDPAEMAKQARAIAQWGRNVFVKIPVMTSTGSTTAPLIRRLSSDGVQVNVTAVFTIAQTRAVIKALNKKAKAIISIFAGRIADTGIDPRDIMRFAVKHTRPHRGFDVLWASTRQVLDISRAEKSGADIITITRDLALKLPLLGRDLTEYSRETVEQFYKDATLSGYTL